MAPIFINGVNQNNIYVNGKKVEKVYLNGQKVFSLSPNPNEILTLVKPFSSFTGNVVRVFNGISEQDFGFVGSDLDSTVESFIALGNGSRKITGWYLANGFMVDFEQAKAPDLELLPDNSYCADFGEEDSSSSNRIPFTGNLLNIVCAIDKPSFVLIREEGSTSRFIGVGQDGSTSFTTAYSGYPTLWNGNTQITNNRDALQNAVSNGFAALNFRNIVFYSSVKYGIGGYGDFAPGTTWTLKGKIKEISTLTFTNDDDANSFISASKIRNNVI